MVEAFKPKVLSKKEVEQARATGELSVKENPKLVKLREAPEEIVAKAIREMLRKDRGEDV